jgi:hypothetical protein
MANTCPLAGTKHFKNCSLTDKSAECGFKADCADMLEDEKRHAVPGTEVTTTFEEKATGSQLEQGNGAHEWPVVTSQKNG